MFEPCAGKGGFLIDIIDRFMDGLAASIPCEKERYRTIVEECLHFADINSLNIFVCRLLVDPHNQFKLNCHKGDTLKMDFGIKFDAVIGNPPYQPPSNGKKGGKSIWTDFVSYALSILTERGFLLYVHPALWRKPGNKMRDVMFNKQIHHLSIHNGADGARVFGASTRYDYYLMENVEPYSKSVVRFEDGKTHEVDISKDLPFIPNFSWTTFSKILAKLNNNGIGVIGDSDCHTARPHVSKTQKNGFGYKLLNSISKTKGATYCYSSRPHKNQTQKKVIFSNGGQIVPFYDNGKLGVTQGGLYILVGNEEQGEKMVKFLNTSVVKMIIKSTKWSNFETNKQIFKYIPDISCMLGDITDASVCEYFGITHI